MIKKIHVPGLVVALMLVGCSGEKENLEQHKSEVSNNQSSLVVAGLTTSATKQVDFVIPVRPTPSSDRTDRFIQRQ